MGSNRYWSNWVKPIDYSSKERPYGSRSNSASNFDLICIAFNCADENTLVGARGGVTYNNLNDIRNPTTGDF